MNTSQLECVIKCDEVLSTHVLGVFAADRIPRQWNKYPYGFIVNTDIHSQPGEHWCAVYSERRGQIDFFDSYGRPPGENSAYIMSWINKNANNEMYNVVQLQSYHSAVCGFYCILFLNQRLLGTSLNDFVELFDNSKPEVNDIFVEDVVTHAYPECISNNAICNQVCTPFTRWVDTDM